MLWVIRSLSMGKNRLGAPSTYIAPPLPAARFPFSSTVLIPPFEDRLGKRGGEGTAVAVRDVVDQAALAVELQHPTADSPAVPVVAGRPAGMSTPDHCPDQPQRRRVNVEDSIDAVAIDDRQFRAPMAPPGPDQPLRPHKQRGSHIEVARESGILARARLGELVAPAGAQKDRRRPRIAGGVGRDHGLAQRTVPRLAPVGHRVIRAGGLVGRRRGGGGNEEREHQEAACEHGGDEGELQGPTR